MSDPVDKPAGPKMYYMVRQKAWFVRVRGVPIRLAADEKSARRRYDEVMADPATFATAALWRSPPPPPPAPKARPPRETTARPRRPDDDKPKVVKVAKVVKDPKGLINHRKVCKLFDVSTAVLMGAVRRGEFVAPHSMLSSYYLFDRATIEYRLEKGTWPKGAEFRGARNATPPDDEA